MFDALREIMAADFQKAEERGVRQGVGIGELRKARETAIKLSSRGNSIGDIADILNVSSQQVEEWLSESLVMA